MAPSIEKFDSLVSSTSFVFLVYFRGHWCPFCMSYLKKLQSIKKEVEGLNGKVIAVTSEPESENPQTRLASGFDGFIVNDTNNILIAEFKKRDLVDIAISEKKGYSHGMGQPAILVVRGEEVLYQWAIVPSLMNFGGAKDRPLLDKVWINVRSQLKGQRAVSDSVGATSLIGLCREKLFG